jgi:hypothetical protein
MDEQEKGVEPKNQKKGTLKRVFTAVALAGVIGIAGLGAVSCANPTNTPTEQGDQKKYDAKGWNINDATDLVNKNGTYYDNEGYNRAGFDKDGYNKAGYNSEGRDREGNKQEQGGDNPGGKDPDQPGGKDPDEPGGKDPDEPNGKDPDQPGGQEPGGQEPGGNDNPGGNISIPTATINVNVLKGIGGTSWADGDTIEGASVNGIRYATIPAILRDFVLQGGTLRSSYTTVKGAYPDIPGIQAIINAETGIANVNNWSGIANGAPTQYSDAIVNAIFTNNASAKTAFNKELTAYQKGAYFEQKQRFNGERTSDGLVTINSSEPSRATLIAELQSALTTADVNTQLAFGSDSSGNTTITNLQAIMNELKTSMLAKINTAMGVDQMNGTNKTQVQTLNSNLLTQIGEDFSQIKAMVDDINDMNNTVISWEYIMDGYTQSEYPQTAMGTQNLWERRSARHHSTEPVTA